MFNLFSTKFSNNFDYIFNCIKCFLFLELWESNNNNFEAGDAEQNNGNTKIILI